MKKNAQIENNKIEIQRLEQSSRYIDPQTMHELRKDLEMTKKSYDVQNLQMTELERREMWHETDMAQLKQQLQAQKQLCNEKDNLIEKLRDYFVEFQQETDVGPEIWKKFHYKLTEMAATYIGRIDGLEQLCKVGFAYRLKKMKWWLNGVLRETLSWLDENSVLVITFDYYKCEEGHCELIDTVVRLQRISHKSNFRAQKKAVK